MRVHLLLPIVPCRWKEGDLPHQRMSAYVSIRQHTSAYVSIRQVVYLAGGKKGIFLSIETFACSFEGEALNLYVDLLQRICAQIHTTQTQTQTQKQTPVHMSRTSSNFTSERSYTRAGLSHTHAHAHTHARTHTRTHARTHAHTHPPDKAYTTSLIQGNSWTCVFLPIAASFLLGFSPVFSQK